MVTDCNGEQRSVSVRENDGWQRGFRRDDVALGACGICTHLTLCSLANEPLAIVCECNNRRRRARALCVLNHAHVLALQDERMVPRGCERASACTCRRKRRPRGPVRRRSHYICNADTIIRHALPLRTETHLHDGDARVGRAQINADDVGGNGAAAVEATGALGRRLGDAGRCSLHSICSWECLK